MSATPTPTPKAAFGDGVGDERELERQAVESAPAAARAAERPAGTPTRRGPARFLAFLRACWSELQRVQWPDRRQVAQATAVVIGFVIVAGAVPRRRGLRRQTTRQRHHLS